MSASSWPGSWSAPAGAPMSSTCTRKRRGEALRILEESQRTWPENARILSSLADLELRRGNRDRAHDLATRAMQLEPAIPAYPLQVAGILAAKGSMDESIRLLEKTRAVLP